MKPEHAVNERANPVAPSWGGRERRVYPRYCIALHVDLRVFAGELPSHLVSATSINVSRGGVLLRLEKLVPEGARCHVVFHACPGLLSPPDVAGKILYRRSQPGGGYDVAIQFDELLTHVTSDQED